MKVPVYWIPENPIGHLAIMPRPRAGDWLNDEIKAWKSEGVTTIVSLLTSLEVRELQLKDEESVCDKFGIKFISFPIPDRQVPRSIDDTKILIAKIKSMLNENHGVAIHCRMGVGRSAMIAACTMCLQGVSHLTVFELIKNARGIKVPDTHEQVEWVYRHFSNR